MDEQRIRQIIREEIVTVLGDYATMPLEVENAIRARGFLNSLSLTGVVQADAGVLSALAGLAGTNSFYVATTSGGAVTHKVDLTRGVITAIT